MANHHIFWTSKSVLISGREDIGDHQKRRKKKKLNAHGREIKRASNNVEGPQNY
jgi:hypothetical protein